MEAVRLNLDLKPIKQTVMKYSLRISGNAWDADDLAQDVMLKLMIAYQKDPNRSLTNAFLYRIAMNTWKDKLKKKANHPIDFTDSLNISHDEHSTRELLEVIALILPARSVIILLLMDIFDFTAKETARLLDATEGAIQAAISRIRGKLKQWSTVSSEGSLPPFKEDAGVHRFVELDTLVDAFKQRDMQAICDTYFGLARQGTVIRCMELKGELLYFTISDPDGNRYRISSKIFI
jgi:RNA polymerase sigma factor (sigma-70 family)